MKALLVFISGEMKFVEIPESLRHKTYSIPVQHSVVSALMFEPSYQISTVTFEWRLQIEGRFGHLFDLFEETR